MPLDIKAEAEMIRKRYLEQPAITKMHAVIVGEKGTGKTSLALTCPTPVLVHSFDTSGTQVLIDGIRAGDILVDNRFEDDDLYNPRAYLLWEGEFNRLRREKFFDAVGTYIIDSTTTLGQSILWQIMRKEGRIPADMAGRNDEKTRGMRTQDWGTILNQFIMISREMAKLPCHTILLGHVGRDKDDMTGEFVSSILVPGQSKDQIPIHVPELLVLVNKQTSKEGVLERYLLTQQEGIYRASTKMGRKGLLSAHEPPDIRALIKKVGFDYEDKPRLVGE